MTAFSRWFLPDGVIGGLLPSADFALLQIPRQDRAPVAPLGGKQIFDANRCIPLECATAQDT